MNTPREHLCEGGILTKEYIAVVGSRHGVKPKAVKKFIDRFNPLTTVFVSGGAVGVDEIAARHARYKGFEVIEILPDYEQFGRVAPLKRNTDIVKRSDSVAAFWNGKSTGTLDTVKKGIELNRPTAIFTADGTLMQFTPARKPERKQVVA